TLNTSCTDVGAPSQFGPLVVGRLPLSGTAAPTLTALTDGGNPTLWFFGAQGPDAGLGNPTAPLIAASATAIAPGGVPSTPINSTLYLASQLMPAETSGSVLALQADGGALDRFDCAGVGACNRTPYVQSSGFKLA